MTVEQVYIKVFIHPMESIKKFSTFIKSRYKLDKQNSLFRNDEEEAIQFSLYHSIHRSEYFTVLVQ